MRQFVSFAAFTLMLNVHTSSVCALDDRTHDYVLDNGLQLIVHEDHRAPVVVSQIWYKVGASYEHDGITGISHALEHMMFKGTQRHGPNEFSTIVAANGGDDNAFTGDDYTAYYQKFDKSKLALSFDLEADRMQNLRLTDEEFAKERKVIMEERRLRTEDEPDAMLYEAVMATAFQTSPYRHPVIGWMHDIEQLTVSDLQSWYKQWYTPNNAVLVVAGDVEPQAVYDLAEKHFSGIPRGPDPVRKETFEPPQSGEKRLVVRAQAQLPEVLLVYKVPVIRAPVHDTSVQKDCYALEVLARLLGGGESARLHKHLVRGKEIAAATGANYDLAARFDKLFVVDGTPAPGHTVAELESAMLREIKSLQTAVASVEELERIKIEAVAAHTYERDSVFAQAMQLGAFTAIGLDWRMKDRYVAELQAVTAADVQRVANRYLQRERLTVGVLEPTSKAQSPP